MDYKMEPEPRDALTILNGEDWSIIFSYLENPMDKYNCYNTCTAFKKLLEPYKNAWLFEEIFPLLPKDDWSWDLQDNETKTCRLVCKSWCKTVDKIYEERNDEGGDNGMEVRLQDLDDLERFLKEMKDHPKNPFVGRCLNLCSDYIADDESKISKYWDKVPNELFPKFGEYIQYLSLDDEGFSHSEALKNQSTRFFKCLHKSLTHLINLRELILNIYQEKKADQMEDLEEYFNENPLPSLPSFRKLELSYCNQDDPPLLMQTLLVDRYSPQLKSLSLEAESYTPQQLQGLKNLEVFDIVGVKPSYIFEDFQLLSCPLQKLNVGYHANLGEVPSKVWNIDGFLQSVQHLPIKELEFTFTTEVSVIESLPIPDELRLSTLHTLELKMFHLNIEISYNFLIAFPSLKNLKIIISKSNRSPGSSNPPKPEVVHFHEFTFSKNLYDSNIWIKLPLLEKIDMEWERVDICCGRDKNVSQTYTREEYIRLRELNFN